MKISAPQVSSANASIQSIEVGQLSVGPVRIGEMTLSNVNLGLSSGQAELTDVSLEITLVLTLVWSIGISLPWPLGNYEIPATTSDLGSLTLTLPLGNISIPGIQEITVTIAEVGATNLQASASPLQNLGLGSANATQLVISGLTLPTGDFQLVGIGLGSGQFTDISFPNGSISSITIGELKGSALPLAQLVLAGIDLPQTAIANIVSGAMNAKAAGDIGEVDANLGVLIVGLRVTPTATLNIGQLALSSLTAGGTIGDATLNSVTIPYDMQNLTLANVDLNTIQIPAVGVA